MTMWFIPYEYRLAVALMFLTLVFGAYGVHEIGEAWRYGTSTRDGVEALFIGGIFFAILLVATWVKGRRRAGRPRRNLE